TSWPRDWSSDVCSSDLTPAIISPLWSGVNGLKLRKEMLARVRGAISGGMLLLIGIVFLVGTVNTFGEIPLARSINQQQNTLVNRSEERRVGKESRLRSS